MKRIILVVGVVVLLAGKVYAESPTEKGVYSLSGSVSYSHSKDNASGDTTKTISVYPAGFYFVYPNLAIGTSIIYSDSKASGLEYKYYGIGPVVRYYFGKDTILPFLSLEYLYTRNKGKMTFGGSSSDSTGRGTDISLGIGVDYFLSKNVALEPIVRYTFSHSDDHYTSSFGMPSGTSNRSEELLVGMGINVFIF
jgi:outer membrane protein W